MFITVRTVIHKTNDTFENHVDILYDILNMMKRSGKYVNGVKYEWAHDYVSHQGFVVMLEGMKLKNLKVKTEMVTQPPKKKF